MRQGSVRVVVSSPSGPALGRRDRLRRLGIAQVPVRLEEAILHLAVRPAWESQGFRGHARRESNRCQGCVTAQAAEEQRTGTVPHVRSVWRARLFPG